jgi:hypothetical protein
MIQDLATLSRLRLFLPYLFEEVRMLRFVMAVMLMSIPFGLSSCDKADIATMEKMGYAKCDILSSRVKSARNAQEDAKQEIQSTLEQFGKVVSYEGGDLEAIIRNWAVNSKIAKTVPTPSGRRSPMSKAWPVPSSRVGTRTWPIFKRRPAAEKPIQTHPNQGTLQRNAWRDETSGATD